MGNRKEKLRAMMNKLSTKYDIGEEMKALAWHGLAQPVFERNKWEGEEPKEMGELLRGHYRI